MQRFVDTHDRNMCARRMVALIGRCRHCKVCFYMYEYIYIIFTENHHSAR